MEEKQAINTATKLLLSKTKDSELHLLQLVDELIVNRYGKERSVLKVLKEKPHIFSKDHVPSFLRVDDKPADPDPREPPVSVSPSDSPGVISIPDEPSSSLLELEQDFEASISSMDVASPSPEVKPAVDAKAGATAGKAQKVGGTRKKKSTKTGSKEQTSVLDEVLALMDKSVKKKVDPDCGQKVDPGEGPTEVPCVLCSDGTMQKKVACCRCKQTFYVCCVQISASGFDSKNWCCSLCTVVCNQASIPSFLSEERSAEPPTPAPHSTSKRTPTDHGPDPTGDQTSKHQSSGKQRKPSTSPPKPKGEQPPGSRATRSKKMLNFDKKLQNIKNSK